MIGRVACIVCLFVRFLGRIFRSFVLRVWILLVGEWAANHTPGGLLGE